ncbi:MAG: hypothetical protein IT453_04130 [Planctomycetes bacterium]|nr:hypothetical protein [Planctomycetota bacterium]
MRAGDASERDSRGLWLALFGVLLAALGAIAWLGPLGGARGPVLGAWLVGQAAWLVAFARAARAPFGAKTVFVGALVLRLVALASDARLSDDVYRYVWEGRMLADGRSPWAASPDSPTFAVEQARDPELFERINHREVSAAYPPLYLAANAGIASAAERLPSAWFESSLSRSVFAFRLAATCADLAVVVALLALCRRRGRPSAAAVAWAWSPLVALEFAGAAHMDALALALWLGGLASLAAHASEPVRANAPGGRSNALVSGAHAILGWTAVGLAGALKFLPWVSAAFGARASGSLRPLAIAATVAAATLAIFACVDEGARGVFGGLAEYSFRWETPNLVHRFVEGGFARVTAYDEGWSDPRRLARGVLLAAWLGWGAWLLARRVEPVAAAGRMVGAFLVLTPTLHPWYAVWILPFLALEPRRSWAVLLALLPLAYWPLAEWQAEGVWREPWWLWPALALPFFALRVREARLARP